MYGSDLATATAASSAFFLALIPFALVFQLFSTFFVGLMLYYFIGNPEKGKSILAAFMRVGARVYANTWMIAMSFIGFVGFSLIVKAFFGLFEGFAYSKSRFSAATTTSSDDLRTGLILVVLAALVYGIHWGMLFVVERATERKGTMVSKLFNIAGLFMTSIFLFTSLFIFVFAVVGQSTPGAVLAWIIGVLPFWVAYALKTVMMVKMEK
jgi:hypothetical protein